MIDTNDQTDVGSQRERSFQAKSVPAGDYVDPELEVVLLDRLFPHMIIGDKANHAWPYLRRDVPHNWYCDDRFPAIGFLNRDEALILYNLALRFSGKAGLEIGSWMGWSTCHLALAGIDLDTFDPVLADGANRASLEEALRVSGLAHNVSIVAEASPQAIHRVAAKGGKKWSFFFIDGNHDAPHPELDAAACLDYAAQDAMFVFHDLVSPDVEKGLAVLRQAGFNTLIYQTMQMMGVAWRGNCAPVNHKPDPTIEWSIPQHLRKYRVAGEGPDTPWCILANRIDGLEEEAREMAAEAKAASSESEQQLMRARAEAQSLRADIDGLRNSARDQELALARSNEKIADLRGQIKDVREVVSAKDQELAKWRADIVRLRTTADDLRLKLREALRAAEASDTAGPLPEPAKTQTTVNAGNSAPSRPPLPDNTTRRAHIPSFVGTAAQASLGLASTLALLLVRGRFRRAAALWRDWKRLSKSQLFDEEFYRRNNLDALRGRADVHYLLHSTEHGRDPNPLFMTGWYLRENPDVAKAGVNPLLHYLSKGAAERRDPSPMFATSWYLNTNLDVAKAGINPLVHYLKYGWREGRNPHPSFDAAFYLEQHPDCGERNQFLDFLARSPGFDRKPTTWSIPEDGVCIVTPDILGPVRNGGIGTACYHFATALARAGRKVSILYTGGSLSEPRRLHWRDHYAKLSITFLSIDDTPPIDRHIWGGTWFLDTSWRIFEFLRTKRFECVHFQDWQANGFWSIRAKKLGMAFQNTVLTVTMHSCSKWIAEGMSSFPPKPVEYAKLVWCETSCMEDCDTLLSPSQHMFEWAKANNIVLPADHRTMPYVMPPSEATQPAGSIDDAHLIFFGRLETRKGLHMFGDALRRLAKEGGLPSKVTFLGKHAEVDGTTSQDYIAALQADLPVITFSTITDFDTFQAQDFVRKSGGVVVIPSLLDNYPLVVLECILNKLPFFAAATGGIVEMVDPAILFQPNVQDFARVLKDRGSIDHRTLQHQYNRGAAGTQWIDFHDNLRATHVASRPADVDLPRISVCIPFYRHGRFLEGLVLAFARQTYPSFEVIFVNDGSGPGFSEEFESVRQRNNDPRFRFVTIENSGPGAARNTAARLATGEILVFFDSDNLPKDDGFLTTVVSALLHSNADCLTIPYDVIDHEVTDPTPANIKATYRPIGSCIQVAFVENVLGDATLAVWRKTFESVGGFPVHRDTNWEDWEFLVQFIVAGKRVVSYPDALYFYRDDPKGRNRSARKYQCHRSRMNRYLSDSGNHAWQIMRDIALPLALREY